MAAFRKVKTVRDGGVWDSNHGLCFLQKPRVDLATFLKRMKYGNTYHYRPDDTPSPHFASLIPNLQTLSKNLYSNFLIVDGST